MVKSKAQACIQWIQEYYKDNPDGKAIIGISGGKDSTIAAALCVEALGTKNCSSDLGVLSNVNAHLLRNIEQVN